MNYSVVKVTFYVCSIEGEELSPETRTYRHAYDNLSGPLEDFIEARLAGEYSPEDYQIIIDSIYLKDISDNEFYNSPLQEL